MPVIAVIQNQSCGVTAGTVACLGYTMPVPAGPNPCQNCAWWDAFCQEAGD